MTGRGGSVACRTGRGNVFKRHHDRERGASLIEFALILPVFMALVLGMFTGGIAYNRKISMTNAVREGSRFGATLDRSTSWAPSVVSRVIDVSGGDLTTGQVCARLVKVNASGTSATDVEPPHPDPCPFPGGEPSTPTGVTNACLAKVWAERTSDLQAMFFTTTLTLTAKSVSRYERTCPT